MTVEVKLDEQYCCDLGPNPDQVTIGKPPTVRLTYSGDTGGKFFVSDLVTKSFSEFNLAHKGDMAGVEVSVQSPLFTHACVAVNLLATRK